MLTALDAYLAHASATEMVVYAALGIIALGTGPFAIANLIDHVLVARVASRAAR